MHPSDTDTIVAVATAPGEGAIGIVRLSGRDAISIASLCFTSGQALATVPDRQLTYGQFVVQGQGLDEVLASVMRGPRTFTGEDIVEFNCHGGPLLLRRAVEALVCCGARLAERGEFTRRAFLNGRMDLTRAEAIADMISAPSDLGLHSAYFQLRGGLYRRFTTMAEDLRHALMLLEAGLDFSEDVIIDWPAVQVPLVSARDEIHRLLSSYHRGKILREGASVVLVGRPNVGKSSLMNRLLEEDRSIVTDIPGTTRDTIEETIDLDGIQVLLVDTAGLRESTNPVEQEGTRRSGLWIERAHVVLFVADGSLSPLPEDLALVAGLVGRLVLPLLNKSDLGTDPRWNTVLGDLPPLLISARTGHGVDELRSRLRHLILGEAPPNDEVVTRQRHADALTSASDAADRAIHALDTHLPGELIALEVREVLDALTSIIGETTSDDVLDRIFKTFCIGK